MGNNVVYMIVSCSVSLCSLSNMKNLVSGVFYFYLSCQLVSGQVLEGLVQLDKQSFDKILNKFDYSLVKFDVGYPTGEKHKSYGSLAVEVSGLSDVFVGEVRIKDYGDKANQDLAERFGVSQDKKNLPETVLFRNQDGVLTEMVRYGGDYSIDNLRTFLPTSLQEQRVKKTERRFSSLLSPGPKRRVERE